MALGLITGEVFICLLTKEGDNWSLGERVPLEKFDSIITHLNFIEQSTLIGVFGGESIHVLILDDSLQLTSKSHPLRIDISCSEMKIDGLKSENEYKLLHDIIHG